MSLSVEEVYNKIADDFNSTRYSVWGSVRGFLDTLESNSHVLEIGCGNGKNMLYRNDLKFTGIDISQAQVDICRKKDLNVIKSNMTELPFPDESFDNAICIATYHHLDNDTTRANALYEMYRVLKFGGSILISVWAMEQPADSLFQFHSSDMFVPWTSRFDGNIYLRYYHIYRFNELLFEINRLCPSFTLISSSYQLGNWFALLSKF
jgi:ubiquinone/menaquinone biosynthesis C-methylase UbiE